MTTTKKITITMSETAPVSIDPEQWPVIASVADHDGKVECQANTEWAIKVREHGDGRRLVYGYAERGSGGKPAGWRPSYAGWLISPESQRPDETGTIRAIRRVAGVIGREDLAAECIGDLPAKEI